MHEHKVERMNADFKAETEAQKAEVLRYRQHAMNAIAMAEKQVEVADKEAALQRERANAETRRTAENHEFVKDNIKLRNVVSDAYALTVLQC